MKGIKIILAALLIAGSATACAKKHAAPAAETQKPAEVAAKDAQAAAPAVKVKNQKVAEVQKALNAHGANLTVDGVMGKSTKNALKEFQTANNLKVTGKADKATLKGLGL